MTTMRMVMMMMTTTTTTMMMTMMMMTMMMMAMMMMTTMMVMMIVMTTTTTMMMAMIMTMMMMAMMMITTTTMTMVMMIPVPRSPARNVNYTINGHHRRHVLVQAEVVPVSLELLSPEVTLRPAAGAPADAGDYLQTSPNALDLIYSIHLGEFLPRYSNSSNSENIFRSGFFP